MGLIQVATETVTSAVASVTLVDSSPTDDVYLVAFNNLLGSTATGVRYRFTVSGSADTSANYDYAQYRLQAQSSFDTTAETNFTEVNFTGVVIGTTVQSGNGLLYIYNMANPSEYTFATNETTNFYNGQSVAGYQGGAVLTENQITDGISLYMSSGNIASGTFTLYKVI